MYRLYSKYKHPDLIVKSERILIRVCADFLIKLELASIYLPEDCIPNIVTIFDKHDKQYPICICGKSS